MRGNIREFITAVAQTLPIPEPIVEVGSFQVERSPYEVDLRSLFPGKTYIGCDARMGPGVDRIEDIHQLSFACGAVGTVIALDTLEHVENPLRALSEIHRVLRPEGFVVISSVMDYPVHEHPADYWRFTPQGFDLLLKDFSPRRVYLQGRPDFPHSVVGVGKKGGSDATLIELDVLVTTISGTSAQEISPRIGPDFFRLLGARLSEEEQWKYPVEMLHLAYDRLLQKDEEIAQLKAELRKFAS
jgi:SAM-dependent methyltransferase